MSDRRIVYQCSDGEGSIEIRCVYPCTAAQHFAEEKAKDGELGGGEDTVITVTDPAGVVTRWRCTCYMEPTIGVVEEK